MHCTTRIVAHHPKFHAGTSSHCCLSSRQTLLALDWVATCGSIVLTTAKFPLTLPQVTHTHTHLNLLLQLPAVIPFTLLTVLLLVARLWTAWTIYSGRHVEGYGGFGGRRFGTQPRFVQL